jgi:hypothetical protein
MSTKIFLLYAPPLRKQGTVGLMYPPLGILYLAAYVRERLPEIEIRVVDGYQTGREQAVREILAFSPDVLGISFGTQSATGAYAVINEVVERLDGQLVVNPMRPLIQDLDSIPFPARDLIDIRSYPGYYYKKARRDTAIISSRGCPHKCVFCSNPVWKEARPYYRLRSPKNVVDEVEALKRDYGIVEFFDQTDIFNGSPRWAKAVCDEFARRKLGVWLKAQMNAHPIDDELASKVKVAGF